MDKQYNKLLGEFYYVAYRLASSTLYNETDDDIGKETVKWCFGILIVGIVANFVIRWIAPVDFRRHILRSSMQVTVLILIGMILLYAVRTNWKEQKGSIRKHNELSKLEREFKKLKTYLNEVAPLDADSQRLWNHTIEYYRAIYCAGFTEEIYENNQSAKDRAVVTYNKKSDITKAQMLDRIKRTRSFVYYKKSGLEDSCTERFVEWEISGILEEENAEYEEYFDRDAYERDVRTAERRAEDYVDVQERMHNYVHNDGPYTNKERYEQGSVGITDYMAQWVQHSDKVDREIREINREDYRKTRVKYTRNVKSRKTCGYYFADASTNEIVFVAFANGIQNRLIHWFPWYIAARQPSDIVPEGFSSDSWILSMMVNAERKKEYDKAIDRQNKYYKSERRRELFEQGLHILKFVITGIVAICVYVFFSQRNWGLQEMLPPLIFIPGMVYFLILNQYLP